MIIARIPMPRLAVIALRYTSSKELTKIYFAAGYYRNIANYYCKRCCVSFLFCLNLVLHFAPSCLLDVFPQEKTEFSCSHQPSFPEGSVLA
jgi:hypothetical protein